MAEYRMIMPVDVSGLIDTLMEHGYDAYAVGGCVRDAMLGREPEDWDITTSAKPMEVKALFAKTLDTGLQHGTVTVMLHGRGYEVTTYRIDGEYDDGRHPREVTFTPDLRMDLERRDFTINAMAYNDQTGLVDMFDGAGDLEKRVIRCVGDPEERFAEDALRMLRAVRFSGQLGFVIGEDTRKAIAKRAEDLKKISSERIRVELTKLLVSPGAGQFRVAYETGMTHVFLPESDRMMSCDQKNHHHIYTVGEHSIRSVERMNLFFARDGAQDLPEHAREKIYGLCEQMDRKRHIVLVMVMLLHDIAKPEMMTVDQNGEGHFHGHPERSAVLARGIMKRLTFDNDSVELAVRLIRHHDYRIEPAPRPVRRAASRIGPDIIWMEFIVQFADILSQNPDTVQRKSEKLDQVMQIYEKIEAAAQPLTIRDLAVNGRDLIGAGIVPGPGLGQMLRGLLEIVLERPEQNRKEELLEEVRKMMKKEPPQKNF